MNTSNNPQDGQNKPQDGSGDFSVITDPRDIHIFRLCAIASMLKLACKGIKMRNHAMAKQSAVEELNKYDRKTKVTTRTSNTALLVALSMHIDELKSKRASVKELDMDGLPSFIAVKKVVDGDAVNEDSEPYKWGSYYVTQSEGTDIIHSTARLHNMASIIISCEDFEDALSDFFDEGEDTNKLGLTVKDYQYFRDTVLDAIMNHWSDERDYAIEKTVRMVRKRNGIIGDSAVEEDADLYASKGKKSRRLSIRLAALLAEINSLGHDESVSTLFDAVTEAYRDVGCELRKDLVLELILMAGYASQEAEQDFSDLERFYSEEAKNTISDLTQKDCETYAEEFKSYADNFGNASVAIAMIYKIFNPKI